MSWEHATCPVCTGGMERVAGRHDDDGRVVMTFRCPIDGTELNVAEPDDNYQSRMELAAKEGP